jgi:hypothetical protein
MTWWLVLVALVAHRQTILKALMALFHDLAQLLLTAAVAEVILALVRPTPAALVVAGPPPLLWLGKVFLDRMLVVTAAVAVVLEKLAEQMAPIRAATVLLLP